MGKALSLHKTGLRRRSSPKRPLISRARALLERLGRDELEVLDGWIHRRMDELERAPRVEASGREVLERKEEGSICYQLERVRCGKRRCRCMRGGKAHGPYWYAYRWHGGRVVSTYIGKNRRPPAPL